MKVVASRRLAWWGALCFAAAVVAGCPGAQRRVVSPEVVPVDLDDPSAPPSLRFLDHWARCTPGETAPQEALIVGPGGVLQAGPLPLRPGEVVALPVPAGPFRAGIRAVGSDVVPVSFEHVASSEAAAPSRPWPVIAEGCSPYQLRSEPLAALVLIAVGDGPGSWGQRLAAATSAAGGAFDGEVRVAGLAVPLRPGRRVTVRVPRGAQAVRLRPAAPWSSACGTPNESLDADGPVGELVAGQRSEVRATIDGAGLVVAIGPCGVVGAWRL